MFEFTLLFTNHCKIPTINNLVRSQDNWFITYQKLVEIEAVVERSEQIKQMVTFLN